MARFLVYFCGLIISVLVMCLINSSSAGFAVASGFGTAFAMLILEAMIVNGRFLKIAWYSLLCYRSYVRVSASYLYRIRVEEKYLLVWGKRFNQFQPVGGVYKAHPSSSGQRSALGMLTDDLLKPDLVSEGDLRNRIPGRNLMGFVRWFESGHGREVDGWREFNEELVASGILPRENFETVAYDVVKRHYNSLRYSKWAQSRELLVADILELIPTPSQLESLRALQARDDTRYLWATEEQIRRRGALANSTSQPTPIAETAEWTI